MSYARQLLDSYQGTVNVDVTLLAAAIDAISDGCSSFRVRGRWRQPGVDLYRTFDRAGRPI